MEGSERLWHAAPVSQVQTGLFPASDGSIQGEEARAKRESQVSFLRAWTDALEGCWPPDAWRFCCCAGEGASAWLCVPAQTGLVTSGSHLDRLHATVGETTEMYEYQMDFLFFSFSLMAVLLSEAQTEILPAPPPLPPI